MPRSEIVPTPTTPSLMGPDTSRSMRGLAPFGEHAASFAFTSDRFDHTSELPPDANAGNRFYGRDVAEFIRSGLAGHGLDSSFLDEDWGWQVHGRRPDESVLEVSIYHNPEEDPAGENDWVLIVRSLRRGRMLGIVPRFQETEIDAHAIATLDDVFRRAGITLTQTAPR
jgi:hypothetical protein